MERCEGLYCFLYESNKKTDWEIYIGLYMGKGTKLTVCFPKREGDTYFEKLQKMTDMILYYLNHQDSPYTVLKLEDRLRDECNRQPSNFVRISYYDGSLDLF